MKIKDILFVAMIIIVCATTSWLLNDNSAAQPPAYTEVQSRQFNDVIGLNLWLAAHPQWDVVSVDGETAWLTRRVKP